MRGGELDDVKRKVKVNKDGRMGEREKKGNQEGKGARRVNGKEERVGTRAMRRDRMR